jgi:tRNA dimethylallyltransferase
MLIVMKRNIQHPFMLIVYGPTGVGKTDLALAIADRIPVEIINMDVGQFYTPLSVGTAKPDWKQSPITHHLFDIIDEPINYTVHEYRKILYKTVKEVIERGNVPILVGGSGFYLRSLFFTQTEMIPDSDVLYVYPQETDLWQELYKIDPERASHIDKADRYRIERALHIWHTTGKLPSSYKSLYNPEVDYILIFVERDRQELKERINARVLTMLDQGWIQEAASLLSTPWQQFVEKKNFIGYKEIFQYELSKKNPLLFSHMVERISAQTRQYAKRQHTFWRKLEREIKIENQYTGTSVGCLETVNLTNREIHLYINELLKRLAFIINR